jgi:putative lipoprotein
MLTRLRLSPRTERVMASNMRPGLGAALTASALLAATGAGAATISGTATYLDRSALPPDATLEVTVEDVSLADAPSKIIGRLVRMPAGQVPIGFEVPYVESAVQPNHRYTVRARITAGGQLRYISTTHTPVLTMGGATSGIALQLQRVSAPPPPASGAVAPAPAGPGTVASAARVDAATKPDRTLVNTYWKLVALNGAAVTVARNQREPHLVLQIQGNRVVGSGGCNRLSGTYTLNGDFVGLANVAATEMACAAGMDQEGAFLRTLGRVKSWRVRGDGLELLDGSNATVLEFVAVDLR